MKTMIYGVTGYTGRLALRTALAAGERPVVAGRNAASVGRIATEHGLEARAFALEDRPTAVESLRDVDAVFSAAGPYSATAEPMVAACLEAGTHYIDVTAENAVFERLQSMDAAARAANVMLLPGLGAGGAPTDCLAAHLKLRLPDATELEFYGGSLEVVSRGTAKSAMEAVHLPTQVRRNGRLVPLAAPIRVSTTIDGEPLDCVTVPLCDVLVAGWSSGIPNITTWVEETGAVKQMSSVPDWLKRVLATRLGQKLVKWQLDRGVEGPTDAERAAGSYRNFAIARNAAGDAVASVARGPEGYTLTALSAFDATRRAARGEGKAGYQTASSAFGSAFFTSLEGCRIEDIDVPEVRPRKDG
ncbi:MAG: saccharopine dehydrogenase NADP-binding domain-containing protein [Myxococcales bacterium]|nr:saccharopine dehydrogenase NADP-binding domain-containing protein [Myxococcales bacterium]